MKKASVNMTEGNILRSLIYFAVPILIGNIFQQLYNVADTAIIGNISGDDALASIGVSAPVYNLIIGFAGGLTNGFAVITARYFGADDKESMKKAVSLTYILSAVTAMLITAVSLISVHPLMTALKTPENIIGDTERYMKIISAFSAVTVAYNMFAGMMRAVGNSKAPLYFLVVSVFVNIVLDILFIKYFNMGVAGAGYATVISQAVSVVLCIVYALKRCRFLIFSRKELSWDRSLISDLIVTGLSMGLMYAIVSVGSVILQGAVNSLGSDTITAHTSARKIDDLFMLPLGTIAMASSTFASQNYGAGKTDRLKKGIYYSILISWAWSAFSTAVVLFFRVPIIKSLTGTSNPAVISTASRYIIWNVSFFFILGVLLTLRSSLQGVGRKAVPISASAVEFSFKLLAVGVLVPRFQYFGICILEPIIWTVCALMVVADYAVFIRRTNSIKEKCMAYSQAV